jgi:hypothetical protein
MRSRTLRSGRWALAAHLATTRSNGYSALFNVICGSSPELEAITMSAGTFYERGKNGGLRLATQMKTEEAGNVWNDPPSSGFRFAVLRAFLLQ